MHDRSLLFTLIITYVCLCCIGFESASSYSFVKVGSNPGQTTIQMNNIGSGSFEPNKIFNWVYESRSPLINPNNGGSCPHNIYNPSIVNNGATNYNIYFGGWDGVSSCHDSVSITVTPDNFMSFNPHVPQIATGSVIHVNNPSTIKVNSNLWIMVTTQLQVNPQLNKPSIATSSSGVGWNPNQGGVASANIEVYGYPYNWGSADVNGGNVLYRDPSTGLYHLYFVDFKQLGRHSTFHAVSGGNLIAFAYTEVTVPQPGKIVNDFKYINGYYVMGLHDNGQAVYYTISKTVNGTFPPPQQLFAHFDTEDKYMVSIGFVVDQSNTRLLGALYGAGATSSLDHNRIFGCWLQKRVLFKSASTIWGVGNAARSMGPNSVLLDTNLHSLSGQFYVYDSNYVSFSNPGTLLAISPVVTVTQGDIWQFNP